MKTVIYPGSFDPLTNGHVDIVKRALNSFEQVIVAVANNPQKNPAFSVEERVALLEASFADKRVTIETFEGLLVHHVQKRGLTTILRGLRAASDFEFEFQLAAMNRKLAPKVESVFMMTGEQNFYVSSSLVREIASFGGDVSAMVPKAVNDALQKKFQSMSAVSS